LLSLNRAGKTSARSFPIVFGFSKQNITTFIFNVMIYFLAISGIPNKFSRNAFLLRWFARYLESSQVELRALHTVDLEPFNTAANPMDLATLVRHARAILLLTPVPKDDWGGSLPPLLRLLPNEAFAHKPVMLVGTGGFVDAMQGLENTLVSDLERLAGRLALPSVHVGVKNWVFVGDQPPWLTAGTEVRLARALDQLQTLAAESSEFLAVA
jgi:NAD(P)H-dependent FMN reductase